MRITRTENCAFLNSGLRKVWRKLVTRISAIILTAALLTVANVAGAETARYRLTVDNTWSEVTHPGLFPVAAHFSWVGGSTHDGSTSFWSPGLETSPGMTMMAETGNTSILIGEMDADLGVGSTMNWANWFCPTAGPVWPDCGDTVVEFEINDTHSFVTIVTMIGPSPDWFVGTEGLPLRSGGDWITEVVVDLRPYDGGTRSDNVWALGGTLNTPPEPVHLITAGTGQLVGPGSLGTFTFTYLEAMPGPDPIPSIGPGGLIALTALLAALGGLTIRKRANG